jgi:hypothetical protein
MRASAAQPLLEAFGVGEHNSTSCCEIWTKNLDQVPSPFYQQGGSGGVKLIGPTVEAVWPVSGSIGGVAYRAQGIEGTSEQKGAESVSAPSRQMFSRKWLWM